MSSEQQLTIGSGVDRGSNSARLHALGNAVVPQCAQIIGEVIRQMLLGAA